MPVLQVPSREIDKGEAKFWTHWNKDTKQVEMVKRCYDVVLVSVVHLIYCCTTGVMVWWLKRPLGSWQTWGLLPKSSHS